MGPPSSREIWSHEDPTGSAADGTEHAIRVGIGESTIGIDLGPNRLEVVPCVVARRQCRVTLEVELAPVGSAVVVVEDVLDALEVGLVRGSLVDMRSDPGADRRCVELVLSCYPRGAERMKSPLLKKIILSC